MVKKMALLLCGVMLLGSTAGCSGKYGQQTTQVERYPQCYAPIKQLRDDEARVTKTTAGSAIGGALAGALIGFATTGKASGAVAGGIAGGVAGGAIGYSVAKQNQIKDQNARMASYLRDLEGDIAKLDAATASARMSRQCYDKEFKLLIADYKNGSISRIQLEKAYAEIKSGQAEASHILGGVIDEDNQRDQEMTAALDSEAKMMGVASPSATGSLKAKTSRSRTALDPVTQGLQRKQAKNADAQLEFQAGRQQQAEQEQILNNYLDEDRGKKATAA